jgi:hypothetical protein
MNVQVSSNLFNIDNPFVWKSLPILVNIDNAYQVELEKFSVRHRAYPKESFSFSNALEKLKYVPTQQQPTIYLTIYIVYSRRIGEPCLLSAGKNSP